MIVLPAENLRCFVQQILEAAGVPGPKARIVAESLVAANLRGVDSHGVLLTPHYIEQLEAGDMDPHNDGRVISENGSCLVYDAEHGIGQVVSAICCDHAVRLAQEHGISMVVARESNHFGAAAFWAQRLSRQGYLGIVMCDASPQVPPWQGKQGRIGTNPICVSVPHPDAQGWLLDMATTQVAYGKIENALLKGETTIPSGWAMDLEGRPTTDITRKVMLMPLGGYKGSGLSMMVEVLCAVLGGGGMSTQLGSIRIHHKFVRVNHVFFAIDVQRFLPLDEFHRRMDWLVANVKSAPPAAGYDEVLVAGEPERRLEEERLRDGIPIPDGPWRTIVAKAEKLGVPVPRG
jgi:LDH2 family malate/lactate/ureidoglycolate dehydrogenase